MKPVPALERAILAALVAGNGRSNRVAGEDELVQRLVGDGVEFTPAELHATLSVMVAQGRVVRRSGYGIWLHSGCNDHLGEIEVGPISAREQRLRWGPAKRAEIVADFAPKI